MTYFLGQPEEGLESLVRFAEKLWEEFVFKVCWAKIFPVSQEQGWELPKKDAQRRLVP